MKVNSQRSLFDEFPEFNKAASIKNRDDAVERVEAHVDVEWQVVALEALRAVAVRQFQLTADDVWAELQQQPAVQTHEHRAMGSVMMIGRRLGMIIPTAQFVPTLKASQHRQPIRVWRSLFYAANRT